MTIERPVYQLAFELDLTPGPAAEYSGPDRGGETDGWVSPEEAGQREAEARTRFEGGEKPEWYEEYEKLIHGGWPFRAAMYIAWAASPRKGRWPENLGSLASVMGLLSPRAIHTWRARNPEIDRQVAVMQAAPLFKARADAFAALVDSASDPDYRHAPDRRTYFMMTGDLEENVNVRRSGAKDDLANMTDAELAEMAAGLGINLTPGPSPDRGGEREERGEKEEGDDE